jgi:c-di-GMP-specific phosphodiesterase
MAERDERELGDALRDALEALGAAEIVAWRWNPARNQVTLTGAAETLGLQALAPRCRLEALIALVAPADQAEARALMTPAPPGSPVLKRLRLTLGDMERTTVWRGSWLEDGAAAGVVSTRVNFVETGRDALTGLLDRNAFLSRTADRLKSKGGVRLVAADLARLRRLNEALGPSGADLVLQALASRLAAAFPPEAAPARIGEDEFALLIDDALIEGVLEGGDPAVTLRNALERPMRIKGFDIHPALWIAESRVEGGEGAPTAEELLRRTALALDAAKAAGKNPMASAAPKSDDDGLSRLALEADLHGALGRGEIKAYFQPIAHLGTGRLAGFEALARWRHPTRGLVMPDDFLPLVAEAGLMSALGRHMLRSAAAQIAAWRSAHPEAGELFVAVNLSTGEIEDERLVDFVAATVREFDLPPRALKVEITESDIMREPERARLVLERLRAAGAGISLDDFGTGFSSLAYLTRLPLETLKIDRYFVRTMAENEGSAKIVKSVATLGRDLGLEVVAEGVETLAVARKLYALGCQYGQGFGYAPALDAQEAEVYLNESYLDEAAPIRVTA